LWFGEEERIRRIAIAMYHHLPRWREENCKHLLQDSCTSCPEPDATIYGYEAIIIIIIVLSWGLPSASST
jgi:hypothetical protein